MYSLFSCIYAVSLLYSGIDPILASHIHIFSLLLSSCVKMRLLFFIPKRLPRCQQTYCSSTSATIRLFSCILWSFLSQGFYCSALSSLEINASRGSYILPGFTEINVAIKNEERGHARPSVFTSSVNQRFHLGFKNADVHYSIDLKFHMYSFPGNRK